MVSYPLPGILSIVDLVDNNGVGHAGYQVSIQFYLGEHGSNFRMGVIQAGGKVNMVITFISLLELARLKRVALFQNELYSDIYIDVIKSLEDFDIDSADGFEPVDESGPAMEAAPGPLQ